MKALDFLVNLKQSRDFDGNLESSLDEAIAELKAPQQSKTCKGCKYEHKDAYSLPCAACVRNCDSDYYEPKDDK